jgi:hypothetical protein
MDAPSTDPGLRRLQLRYSAACVGCGIALARGTEAWYRQATREVRCLACGPAERFEDVPAPDPGVAGASARREFERRHANRQADVKNRLGVRLGGIVLALTDDPQSTRAWARGARGEEKLAAALAEVSGVRVLHDRRVPGTRGNLDHLVVSPAGVFVVDAKRYQGMVRVRDRGGWFRTDLRLYVGHRDCSQLVDQMGWQIEAVTAALGASGVASLPPITPVLCFVDAEWPLLRPPGTFRGVRLEGTRSIRRLVTAAQVLDEATIERLTGILGTAFPPK